MYFENLRNNKNQLLSLMKNNGYSAGYITNIRRQIDFILSNCDKYGWKSYRDVYEHYLHLPYSSSYLRNKLNYIGVIQNFYEFGFMPNGKRRHNLYDRGYYCKLCDEFKELIDFYKNHEKNRKKNTTIEAETKNASKFLFEMQKRNKYSLDEISEEDVLSFFLSQNGELIRSYSYKKQLVSVFKAGLDWNKARCQNIINYLPRLREKRKNIQYLTSKEIEAIKKTLDTDKVSLRDKAIILLLIYTGLRGCDIVSLTLNSIDWENEKILIVQQKTSVFLELPLIPILGNAIYDYITLERPEVDIENIFLTETAHVSYLESRSIGNIATKIFKKANIRQNLGDRKGTHIFRHNVASSLLENGVPQPVITQTLGHTDPHSLETYIKADFVHLKECSLSVESYPIPKEVFFI